MAAYNAGVKTVLIPYENLKDIKDIDPLARENLQFIPCKTLSDVLKNALISLDAESILEETLPHLANTETISHSTAIYRK